MISSRSSCGTSSMVVSGWDIFQSASDADAGLPGHLLILDIYQSARDVRVENNGEKRLRGTNTSRIFNQEPKKKNL